MKFKRLATFVALFAVSVTALTFIQSGNAFAATWTGGGDKTSFNDAANWGGTLPGSGEDVNITPNGTNILDGNHLNYNLNYGVGDINLTYTSWQGQLFIGGTTRVKGDVTFSANSDKVSLLLNALENVDNPLTPVSQLTLDGLSFGVSSNTLIDTLRLTGGAHIPTAGNDAHHEIGTVIVLATQTTEGCIGLSTATIGHIELAFGSTLEINCNIDKENLSLIKAYEMSTISVSPINSQGDDKDIVIGSDLSVEAGGAVTIEALLDANIIWTGNISLGEGTLNLEEDTELTVKPSEQTTTIDDERGQWKLILEDGKTVVVNGSVGEVTVDSGGVLKGIGTVGALMVLDGGTVAPGQSPGCLTASDTTFNPGSIFEVEIAGKTPCTEYDQLKVNGTVDAGTAKLDLKFLNGFKPGVGDKFTIIENDGTDPVSGAFQDLPVGTTFTVDGVAFKIDYDGGDGNDVVLTVQSVPTTPNTGIQLLTTNPLLTLTLTALSTGALFVLARRYSMVTNKK